MAGEMSGHICFADNCFGYDDEMFAACQLLQIVSASSLRLGEMVQQLLKAGSTPEIRNFCEDEKIIWNRW